MPPHVLGQVARVKEEALRSRVVAPQVGGSGHRCGQDLVQIHGHAGRCQEFGHLTASPGGGVGGKAQRDPKVAQCGQRAGRAVDRHPRNRQHAVYVDEQAVDLTHVDLRSIIVTPDPRRWRGPTSQVIGTDRGSARQ